MLSEKALFSVVVPALNEAEHIGNLLRSVHGQEYRPLEVVVVDDGSVDDTKLIVTDVCGQLCDSQFNIHLLETTDKKGAACARNLGIQKSSGKYVLLIDADCLIDDKKIINELSKVLNSNMVAGLRDIILVDNWLEYNQMLDAGNPPYATPASWSHLAFRRELLEQFSFDPNLGVGEDADFLMRIKNSDKMGNVVTIKETGLMHLPHTLNEYWQQSFWVGKTRWLFQKKHPGAKAKLATTMRAIPAILLAMTAITLFINQFLAIAFISVWVALVLYYYLNSRDKKPKRLAYLLLRFTYNSFSYTIGLLKGFIDLYIKGTINPSRGK